MRCHSLNFRFEFNCEQQDLLFTLNWIVFVFSTITNCFPSLPPIASVAICDCGKTKRFFSWNFGVLKTPKFHEKNRFEAPKLHKIVKFRNRSGLARSRCAVWVPRVRFVCVCYSVDDDSGIFVHFISSVQWSRSRLGDWSSSGCEAITDSKYYRHERGR